MTEGRARRSVQTALAYAFAASFLVYLQPLIFPHVLSVWGFALWAEIAGFADREPLWMAADLGLAFLIQLAMGAFFYWVFRGRARLRVLGLIAMFPASTAALLYLYMMVIPAHFLIEPETHAESGDWPVACDIENASLAQVKAGVTLALERAGEAWLHRNPGRRYGLLRMPGCAVSEIVPPQNGSLQHALPGGVGLYLVLNKDTGRYGLFHRSPNGVAPLKLDLTTDERFSAILSPDGGTVFWLKRLRGERGATTGYEIHGRNLAAGNRTAIRLLLKGPATIGLLSANPTTDRYILTRNGKDVFEIDRTGATVWGPVSSPGFHISRNNWRKAGNGWIAWESYRDRGRHRVIWSLPGGTRVHEIPIHEIPIHEIPKGRNIKDVSVSPSGDLIAISVGSALNIGDIKNAVYVLRTADGAEIFRRYFKRYTRSRVAFLGDAYFAYTRYEETGQRRRGHVMVLGVPASR